MRFDDYTTTAREVVREANEASRESGHATLGTAQVLLTLLDTSKSDASLLWSHLGTQTATLREAIRHALSQQPTVTGAHREDQRVEDQVRFRDAILFSE